MMRMVCVHVVTDKNTNNETVCSETFRDSIHRKVWKLLTGEWWDGVGGNVLVTCRFHVEHTDDATLPATW